MPWQQKHDGGNFDHNCLHNSDGILNQRPLTSVSDDIDSSKAVSPNHFLIGSSGSKIFRINSNGYGA